MNTFSIQYWGKLALALVIILTGLPAIILRGLAGLTFMFGLWQAIAAVSLGVSIPVLAWKAADIIRVVTNVKNNRKG